MKKSTGHIAESHRRQFAGEEADQASGAIIVLVEHGQMQLIITNHAQHLTDLHQPAGRGEERMPGRQRLGDV